MKHILLVRHAKSGWDDDIKADFDRRLTKQGNKDAAEMAALIHRNVPQIDHILSSSSVRAMATTQYFADAYNIDFANIVADIGLYEKNHLYARRLLASQNDTHNTILLVAHNPMITDLFMQLTSSLTFTLEACSVSYIEFPIQHWSEINDCRGKLIFTEAPLF